MNHTLKSFTDQVHKMRLAQERYTNLVVIAATTGIYKKEMLDAQVIAKKLEKQVDDSIQEINKMLAVPAPLPESAPAPKSYFETENF